MKNKSTHSPGLNWKTVRPFVGVAALAVGTLFVPASVHAQYASSVTAYTQGSGVTAGYNNASVALGAPTVDISYQNADPFNPPFLPNNIVGLGTNGGSLTLHFNTPIQNNPGNPFGLDFIIFGHAGFNEDFGNFTVSDGSLFTSATDIRVSVSSDGVTFYTLNPALTPQVDGLFPTDASGNPLQPVNPALTAADFIGKDLAGIAALYGGSAGGAGFDLAWARDQNNQSVSLSSVEFVRLDVVGENGPGYIDAVSVVPEPTTCTLLMAGASLLWLRRRAR